MEWTDKLNGMRYRTDIQLQKQKRKREKMQKENHVTFKKLGLYLLKHMISDRQTDEKI